MLNFVCILHKALSLPVQYNQMSKPARFLIPQPRSYFRDDHNQSCRKRLMAGGGLDAMEKFHKTVNCAAFYFIMFLH